MGGSDVSAVRPDGAVADEEVAREVAAVWYPVELLRPWVDNPRKNDKAVMKVVRSIKRFGFGAPLLARMENKELIAGHTRLKAAFQLGIKQVPVRFLDLDPSDAHMLALADNRVGEEAEWDPEKLPDILRDLSEEDWAETGFSEKELRGLLFEEGVGDGEIIPVPSEPITKPGDVWQLGRHRLACGDSRASVTFAALMMPGELVSLYLTDPPYGLSYDGPVKKREKIANDSLTGEKLRDELLAPAFALAAAAMAPGASFYIYFSDSEALAFIQAAQELGGYRQMPIWVKDQMIPGRKEYHYKHEPILFGWKPGAAHLALPDRKQTTVWEFARPKRSDEHPTMKPVEMFSYAIQMSSAPGSIVLDSFSGSGTTLIACENTGRIARCIELDPGYCDVIVKRWETLTGQKAVLVSGLVDPGQGSEPVAESGKWKLKPPTSSTNS